MVRERTLYEVLGVAPSAREEAIRAAHRGLVRTLHPDVNLAPDAAERFGIVQRAYEVLIDADKRAAYDRMLAAARHGRERMPSVAEVVAPTYAWVNVGGRRAASAHVAREEAKEELEEIWRVFFEPRARARRGEG